MIIISLFDLKKTKVSLYSKTFVEIKLKYLSVIKMPIFSEIENKFKRSLD